jgi:peptidoglycan/xylan/chitin deacetylase (PgdA/CDA1 family)
VTIERRAVLKAAVIAMAGAALGEQVAACDDHGTTASGTPTGAAATPVPSSGTPAGQTAPAPAAPAPTAPDTSSTAGTGTSPSAHAGGPAIEIVHGPAAATGVALTFHGAGDPALATHLLGEVEAAGAHVTVLAVGSWLEQQPQMAKRILDGGHELGNHTYSHLTMPRLSSTVDDSEITRCADVLRRLTGSQGRWFRPSGTVHATAAILAAAGRAGYPNCLSYDVDPSDYADPGAAKVVARVLAGVRPGSIVSLHLGHAGTVQAMPHILEGLRARGLPAVTMSSLMNVGVVG